jgi:hypothetical protein
MREAGSRERTRIEKAEVGVASSRNVNPCASRRRGRLSGLIMDTYHAAGVKRGIAITASDPGRPGLITVDYEGVEPND